MIVLIPDHCLPIFNLRKSKLHAYSMLQFIPFVPTTVDISIIRNRMSQLTNLALSCKYMKISLFFLSLHKVAVQRGWILIRGGIVESGDRHRYNLQCRGILFI